MHLSRWLCACSVLHTLVQHLLLTQQPHAHSPWAAAQQIQKAHLGHPNRMEPLESSNNPVTLQTLLTDHVSFQSEVQYRFTEHRARNKITRTTIKHTKFSHENIWQTNWHQSKGKINTILCMWSQQVILHNLKTTKIWRNVFSLDGVPVVERTWS